MILAHVREQAEPRRGEQVTLLSFTQHQVTGLCPAAGAAPRITPPVMSRRSLTGCHVNVTLPLASLSDSTSETWLREGKECVTPPGLPPTGGLVTRSASCDRGPASHTRPEPGRRDRPWHRLRRMGSGQEGRGCPQESEWRVHQTPGSLFQAVGAGPAAGRSGRRNSRAKREGIVKGSSLSSSHTMEYCSALKGNESDTCYSVDGP